MGCDNSAAAFLFIKPVVNTFKSKLEMRFVCGLALVIKINNEITPLPSNVSGSSVVAPHGTT